MICQAIALLLILVLPEQEEKVQPLEIVRVKSAEDGIQRFFSKEVDVFGVKVFATKECGGRFKRVPRRYPDGAWYTYDDRSCDYGCMVTEYVYWGLTSILGAQDYPGRFDDIRREWRLNTKEKVQKGDEALYRLLSDPKYKLPTRLPNGRYPDPK